jgi:hypothetical protein
MPPLNWSPGALAALTNKDERAEMTRLFEAYFRVTENLPTATVLHLDLPRRRHDRYHFSAKFRKSAGWVVEASLKEEHRQVWWGSRWPSGNRP